MSNPEKTEFRIDHYENIYPVGIEFHYWQIARNNILLQEITKYCSKSDRILEVGCGRGDVLAHMRKNGFDYWGVELAADVPVIEAQKQYITIGTDANLLPEEFRYSIKIITLFDVIEHLPNPTEFLESLKKSYPNLSHFIITVPACQEIWSNYDEFNGHYRRYNLKMMKEQSEAIGASLLMNRFFFKMLYLPARLLKVLGKKRTVELKGPKPGISRWIHQFIAFGSQIYDRLLPNSVKGSSVISVLKVR
jgi:SAM-dependent methyltransferase